MPLYITWCEVGTGAKQALKGPWNQELCPDGAKNACKTALISLTFLTLRKNPDYYARSMHASRFSFAFTYRYFFASGGEADGVLRMK